LFLSLGRSLLRGDLTEVLPNELCLIEID